MLTPAVYIDTVLGSLLCNLRDMGWILWVKKLVYCILLHTPPSPSTPSHTHTQSGPLPFSFSAPKNCKETKLQPSSVPLPSLTPTSLPPPSLPPLRPPLAKPKLPQANPLPPLKSVSVEQILKQPEFQLGGKKEKAAPSEVIDLTDEEEEKQEVAKVRVYVRCLGMVTA